MWVPWKIYYEGMVSFNCLNCVVWFPNRNVGTQNENPGIAFILSAEF